MLIYMRIKNIAIHVQVIINNGLSNYTNTVVNEVAPSKPEYLVTNQLNSRGSFCNF